MVDSDDNGQYPDGTPRQLGRYRLVRPVSTGGMARVFEGRRESLAGVAPRVAVKVILPQHAHDENFRDLFVNEARIGSLLSHQNVVQIQDFDCEHGVYYLVMEFVEGLTVRKAIDTCRRFKRSIPIAVIAELSRQVCDGLSYAHSIVDADGRPLCLVHRDIKPSNLIAGPQGVVKILDFGISKALISREKTGAVRGTWGYMAPEQAEGQEVGGAADLYALASVIYEMATLGPLFTERDPVAIRDLMASDEPARRASALTGPHSGLGGVLVRALQRDPAARFSSAKAMGKALAEMGSDPVTARDHLLLFQRTIRQLDEQGRLDEPGNPKEASANIDSASSSSVAGGLGIAVGNRERAHQPGASVPVRRVITRRRRRLTLQARLILIAFFLLVGSALGFWMWNTLKHEDQGSTESAQNMVIEESASDPMVLDRDDASIEGAISSVESGGNSDEVVTALSNDVEPPEGSVEAANSPGTVPVDGPRLVQPEPVTISVNTDENIAPMAAEETRGPSENWVDITVYVGMRDRVSIDDGEMRAGPRVEDSVAPGTHTVTVVNDGETYTLDVSLDAGEQAILRLNKSSEPYTLERTE